MILHVVQDDSARLTLFPAKLNFYKLMKKRGLEGHCGLYSVNIMGSQIASARDELMAMPYFEEAKR